MPQIARCSSCACELPLDAPRALCPACLLAVGLAPHSSEGSRPTADTAALAPPSSYSSSAFTAADEPPNSDHELPTIPRYRLNRVIGAGGMGVVYEAEQQLPVRRTVALKLIKLGMDTRQVIARFESERQALALMHHRNIAAVFDAGVTDLGRPFFVMEYVPGEPITQFCDRHRYTIRQRLELFLQACHAIQHAHTKAILHRDVKPSNVLVMLEDGEPVVKVIDFGIAKAVAQGLEQHTAWTEAGQMIGTPEYMSPEQAEVGQLDVDTRTDIYSLGVVLYELITGALPFDSAALRAGSYERLQQIIRDVDPPRPSVRLSWLGESSLQVAQLRQTSVTALTRELRSELEWIPLMAMRKDRAKRYRTASELTADVENFLHNRPLVAAPESLAYRLRKLARRNRGSLAAAALVTVALVAGIITTSSMYLRSERQRLEAVRQKELAQARFDDVRKLANTFLFEFYNELENVEGTTKAREMLVKIAAEYLGKLAADAASDVSLRRELAIAYQKIGEVQTNSGPLKWADLKGGMESYRKALQISVALTAADPTNAADQRILSLCHQGIGVLLSDDDQAAALESFRRSLEISQRLADADPTNEHGQRELLFGHRRIGDMLAALGNVNGALESFREARQISQKLAAADPTNLGAQSNLSTVHQKIGGMLVISGDTKGALESYRTALQISRKWAAAEPMNPRAQRDLAIGYQKIGRILEDTGDTQGALASFRKFLEISEKLAGPIDPMNAQAQRDLSVAYQNMVRMLAASGDTKGASETCLKVVEITQKLAAADPTSGDAQRDLEAAYQNMVDINQAWATADPTNALAQQSLRASHRNVGKMLAVRDTKGALESYREARQISQKLAAADLTNLGAQCDVAADHSAIGDMLAANGDTKGALAGYREALQISHQLAAADPNNVKVQHRLSDDYEKLGYVLAISSDTKGALESYRASLEINRKRADADPTDATAQADLLLSFNRVGEILEKMSSDAGRTTGERIELLSEARDWYMRASQQSDLLKQRNIVPRNIAQEASEIARLPARCDAAIAALKAATTRPSATAPSLVPPVTTQPSN